MIKESAETITCRIGKGWSFPVFLTLHNAFRVVNNTMSKNLDIIL